MPTDNNFTNAIVACAIINNKAAIKSIIEQRQGNDLEIILNNALHRCSQINDEDQAMVAILKACPTGGKLEVVMFSFAIFLTATKKNKTTLKNIINACSTDKKIKLKILSYAIRYCAEKKNHASIKIIINECPNDEKERLKIFGYTFAICVSKVNSNTLSKILNAFTDNYIIQAKILSNAIIYCILNNNKISINKITKYLDERNLTVNFYGIIMAEFALKNNKNALNLLIGIKPDNLKVKMFGTSITNCAIDNNKLALKILINKAKDTFPDNQKEALITEAKEYLKENNFKGALALLTTLTDEPKLKEDFSKMKNTTNGKATKERKRKDNNKKMPLKKRRVTFKPTS